MKLFTNSRRSVTASSLITYALFQIAIIVFLICCSMQLKADCLIPSGRTVYASDDPFASCTGALIIEGTLVINSNYDLSALPITSLTVDGGTIDWSANRDLALPGIPLVLTNGGQITPSGSGEACNSNKTLTFEGSKYASCNGNSAYLSFAEVNAEGGVNFSSQLPVELVSFAGGNEQDKIRLQWHTASEKDNAHFIIEHSIDGDRFEAIGLVKGMGTTAEASFYAFEDNRTLSGLQYYRLQQVDKDGTTAFSPMIAIEVKTKNLENIQIWPNPATNYFYIAGISETRSTNIVLYNAQGQQIATQLFNEGSQYRMELPNNLIPGYYVIRFTNQQTSLVQSIIIR